MFGRRRSLESCTLIKLLELTQVLLLNNNSDDVVVRVGSVSSLNSQSHAHMDEKWGCQWRQKGKHPHMRDVDSAQELTHVGAANKGHFTHEPQSRDHDIVTAQKKSVPRPSQHTSTVI